MGNCIFKTKIIDEPKESPIRNISKPEKIIKGNEVSYYADQAIPGMVNNENK